jgi:hypothetical protein
MLKLTQNLEIDNLEINEIQKGINLLGLEISDLELEQLKSGNIVSLESKSLSEIGSMLILAEALLKMNSVKAVRCSELREVIKNSFHSSGLPVYGWHSEIFGKCYLLLTSVDGQLGIKVVAIMPTLSS